MSKKCLIRREERRRTMFLKFEKLRKGLIEIIKNPVSNMHDKHIANKKIQKMPKDSGLCRQRRRCWKTGRPRGVYRMFGLCRHMIRYYANEGDIPGLKKSSW